MKKSLVRDLRRVKRSYQIRRQRISQRLKFISLMNLDRLGKTLKSRTQPRGRGKELRNIKTKLKSLRKRMTCDLSLKIRLSHQKL